MFTQLLQRMHVRALPLHAGARDELFKLYDKEPPGAQAVVWAIDHGHIDGSNYGDWRGAALTAGCVYAQVGTAVGRLATDLKQDLGFEPHAGLTPLERVISSARAGDTSRTHAGLWWVRRWTLQWLQQNGRTPTPLGLREPRAFPLRLAPA